MYVIAIHPYRYLRDPVTGAKQSFFSARRVGDGLEVVTCGYTFEMSNGTYGMGEPAKTLEDAQKRALRCNLAWIETMASHGRCHPESAPRCAHLIAATPLVFDTGAA